jgi:toxin ParE1/3/4
MQNKFRLQFTKEANSDLTGIFDYITNNLSAPVSAVELIDKLEKSCRLLTQFPFSGAIPRDNILAKKGYRIITVDNFIVFYVVDDTAVKIMRVLYGKRDYSNLL